MKRLIAMSLLVAGLVAATPVHAETVSTCTTVYGGGSVCGETTTTVTVEHQPVNTAVDPVLFWKVVAIVGGVAAVATILYKFSYRWYILG